jgi:hypothetical protein
MASVVIEVAGAVFVTNERNRPAILAAVADAIRAAAATGMCAAVPVVVHRAGAECEHTRAVAEGE